MATGVVKMFNTTKGFGFITPTEGGKDLHVLATAMQAGSTGGLKEGMRVEFTRSEGAKGPFATDVRVIPSDSPIVPQASVPKTANADVTQPMPATVPFVASTELPKSGAATVPASTCCGEKTTAQPGKS